MVQSQDASSVNVFLDYNMSEDTSHFNIYSTTLKLQQKHHQASYHYSKTVLYNGNSTVNTSITGLLPNTTYTCCVLAVTSYRESKPVCQNITTTITQVMNIMFTSRSDLVYLYRCKEHILCTKSFNNIYHLFS